MSPKTTSNLTKLWEFLKSVSQGVVIFLLTAILKYQKMSYDNQIMMNNRMNNAETSISTQGKTQESIITKQQMNDKQITFLFAHFGLPLINQ